jgi:hypothetical protein
MTCSRCSGLMLEELMLDIEGGFGEMWTKSRRCVNCGHIHDAVMERNGPAHTKKNLAYASSKLESQEDDAHLGVESYVESYYQKAA